MRCGGEQVFLIKNFYFSPISREMRSLFFFIFPLIFASLRIIWARSVGLIMKPFLGDLRYMLLRALNGAKSVSSSVLCSFLENVLTKKKGKEN